jgi:hypothetical protein
VDEETGTVGVPYNGTTTQFKCDRIFSPRSCQEVCVCVRERESKERRETHVPFLAQLHRSSNCSFITPGWHMPCVCVCVRACVRVCVCVCA